MSEANVIAGIKTVIHSVTGFVSTSVTVEDWSVLDGPFANSPFFVLEMSDEFVSRQGTREDVTTWNIKGTLYVAFENWAISRSTLRSYRQAIIDKFNEVGTARSAGGLEATDINEIRSGGAVTEIYQAYNVQELTPESLPMCIAQEFVFVCEEY
mgnify:FL=1